MNRKSIPEKIKKILQREISSRCPFCNNEEVAHFEFHHIDEDPANNDIKNLLMLCPICHSKITKGDITIEEVLSMKRKLLNEAAVPEITANNLIAFKSKINNAVVGNNNKVIIHPKRPIVKVKYPEGCIGADNNKANYIGFLISRYNEYKEWEVGKEQMKYGLFPSKLKKHYRIGTSRTIYNMPIERFDELVQHIQSRIDGTVLAKVNRSKGIFKNYPTFQEHLLEMQG